MEAMAANSKAKNKSVGAALIGYVQSKVKGGSEVRHIL
jgi:hypothetical protein